MKKIFNWILDKWLAGFITASFFFALKYYLETPNKSRPSFFSFKWMGDFLNTNIPLWWCLLIVFCMILLARIDKWVYRNKNKTVDNDLDYYKTPFNQYGNYTKDTFGPNRTVWTWSYRWDVHKRQFIIEDALPSCRTCGTPLDLEDRFGWKTSASCSKCRLDGKYYMHEMTESPNDVQKEIIRRIQSGEVSKSQ